MIVSAFSWVAVLTFVGLLGIWGGYPVGIWLLSRAIRSPIRPDTARGASRRVTALLATREPAELVRERVQNLLDTAHPGHLLKVVVGLDSIDALISVTEVEAIDPRVRAVIGDAPGGKASTLNAAARFADGDVLVLADSAQRFDRETIPALVAALEDARFGAVSGALLLPSGGVKTWPIRIYWHIEKAILYSESLVHSSVGVTGAVYAVRRALWAPMPAGVILDDLFVPLSLVLRGHRIGFLHDAVAIESRTFNAKQESIRKTRTLTGTLQLPNLIPGLFSPRRNPVLVQLLLHKYARLLSPFFLLTMLVSGGFVVGSIVVRQGTAAILTILLLLVAITAIGPLRRLIGSAFSWTFEMQIATARAVQNAARGRWDVWG